MQKNWIGIVALSLATSMAFGQTRVYSPVKTIKDQGMTLKGWGSGSISETTETFYEGAYSLRVSTRNFFQGGMVSLATPQDLSSAYGDKTSLLRVAIRVADSQMKLSGGNSGGGAIGSPGSKGGPPGEAGAGGPPAGADNNGGINTGGSNQKRGGGLGNAGAAPGDDEPKRGGNMGATMKTDGLKRIRLIITTTDNLKSEAYVNVDTTAAGTSPWKTVAFPLAAIRGFDRTNKTIKEMAFSGDATATFYIGDMQIVNDSTPLSGEVNVSTLNLALGDEVELKARGYGGSSVLKYSWDFDDRDGIQSDAEGPIVRRKFRKDGTFKVTLTISDEYGLKKPYTTTISVKVNP